MFRSLPRFLFLTRAMTKILDRWLPSFTLAVWSAVLLYFYTSGRLAQFLHPSFRPGVLIAGGVLLLLALGSALAGRLECCEDDACSHSVSRTTSGKIVAFAVLLLPLGLAFAYSRDGFGLTAISNRGVTMDARGMAGPAAEPGVVDSYLPRAKSGNIEVSVIDLLYGAQDAGLRAEFEGKTVEVVGQLMEEKAANPHGNRMKIVRMFMTCCAADAKPVGALVEVPVPADGDLPPELSWVRVVGTPTFPTEGGRPVAVLKAVSISVTAPPEETMLF